MRVAQLMLKYVRLPTRGLQARIARELGISRSTVCRDIAAMEEEVRRGLPCRLCGTRVTPTHRHTHGDDGWSGVSYDWRGDGDGDGDGGTIWDALAGTARPEQLPPEVLAALEAAISRQCHDRVAERIAAALRLPCGLREQPPALPATEPDPTVNRLGGEPSSNGAGYHA
jgi:hypothetical protein